MCACVCMQLEGLRFLWRNLVDEHLVAGDDKDSAGGAILAHTMGGCDTCGQCSAERKCPVSFRCHDALSNWMIANMYVISMSKTQIRHGLVTPALQGWASP